MYRTRRDLTRRANRDSRNTIPLPLSLRSLARATSNRQALTRGASRDWLEARLARRFYTSDCLPPAAHDAYVRTGGAATGPLERYLALADAVSNRSGKTPWFNALV